MTKNYSQYTNINLPNLPKNSVKLIFADSRLSNACKNTLEKHGIELLNVPQSKFLASPVCGHPDMQILHIEHGKWLMTDELYHHFKNECSQLEIEPINGGVADPFLHYPENVFLNCAVFGDYLIMNRRTVHPKILQFAEETKKTVLEVKQGYTKCAVCIVDAHSIITEDEGIYHAAKKRSELDVLFLKNREVSLTGYDCGFIGGASGKLNETTLAFTGCIESHSQYTEIEKFCRDRSVSVVSLGEEALYDYGSLLPIAEVTYEETKNRSKSEDESDKNIQVNKRILELTKSQLPR